MVQTVLLSKQGYRSPHFKKGVVPIGVQYTYFLKELASRLLRHYGRPNHFNKTRLLDELVFILLSSKTQEVKYLAAYRTLKNKCGSWKRFLDLHPGTLERLLRPAGLARRKVRTLRMVFLRLRRDFGDVSLAKLSKLTPRAESYLTSLPGIGLKTARCILMYARGVDVFPVDTHAFRILRRLGLTDKRRLTAHEQNRLQQMIPRHLRHDLHVTLISHGREVCTAKNPRCSACCVEHLCPKLF